MDNKNNKKAKILKTQTSHFPFVMVVFSCILLYLIVQGVLLIRHHTIEVYNIGISETDNVKGTYTGILLRNEENFYSDCDGFLHLFSLNGDYVGESARLLSVDKDGTVLTKLRELYHGHTGLSYESRVIVQQTIETNMKEYDPSNFDSVRDIKGRIEAAVMNRLLHDGDKQLEDYLSEASYTVFSSSRNGFFLTWNDGMEGKPISAIPSSAFSENLLTSVSSSGKEISNGTFLYKLAYDNGFTLNFLLSPEDKLAFSNQKELTILMEDGITIRGAYSVSETSDGVSVGTLTFSKYGANYLSKRKYSFRILNESVQGYKIPQSSIVTKDFFVVPESFIVDGPNHSEGIMRAGDSLPVFTSTVVYRKNSDPRNNFVYGDDVVYVFGDTLHAGDILVSPGESRDTYTLGKMVSVEGCYQINNGYCVFKPIVRVENSLDTSYVIISDGVIGGLRSYDRIVQNAADMKENEIIFE